MHSGIAKNVGRWSREEQGLLDLKCKNNARKLGCREPNADVEARSEHDWVKHGSVTAIRC